MVTRLSMETKTIKNGFNVGINFKDAGSYVSKDAADFYFIIQVYNPSQALEILREESDGKISKARIIWAGLSNAPRRHFYTIKYR